MGLNTDVFLFLLEDSRVFEHLKRRLWERTPYDSALGYTSALGYWNHKARNRDRVLLVHIPQGICTQQLRRRLAQNFNLRGQLILTQADMSHQPFTTHSEDPSAIFMTTEMLGAPHKNGLAMATPSASSLLLDTAVDAHHRFQVSRNPQFLGLNDRAAFLAADAAAEIRSQLGEEDIPPVEVAAHTCTLSPMLDHTDVPSLLISRGYSEAFPDGMVPFDYIHHICGALLGAPLPGGDGKVRKAITVEISAEHESELRQWLSDHGGSEARKRKNRQHRPLQDNGEVVGKLQVKATKDPKVEPCSRQLGGFKNEASQNQSQTHRPRHLILGIGGTGRNAIFELRNGTVSRPQDNPMALVGLLGGERISPMEGDAQCVSGRFGGLPKPDNNLQVLNQAEDHQKLIVLKPWSSKRMDFHWKDEPLWNLSAISKWPLENTLLHFLYIVWKCLGIYITGRIQKKQGIAVSNGFVLKSTQGYTVAWVDTTLLKGKLNFGTNRWDLVQCSRPITKHYAITELYPVLYQGKASTRKIRYQMTQATLIKVYEEQKGQNEAKQKPGKKRRKTRGSQSWYLLSIRNKFPVGKQAIRGQDRRGKPSTTVLML